MIQAHWARESRYVEALKIKSSACVDYFVEENPEVQTYDALRFCSLPGCESGAVLDTHDQPAEARAACLSDYLDYYRRSENYNTRGRHRPGADS